MPEGQGDSQAKGILKRAGQTAPSQSWELLRQLPGNGGKEDLTAYLKAWAHDKIGGVSGELETPAGGCGLGGFAGSRLWFKTKVTASHRKHCSNQGLLRLGVWPVFLKLFKAPSKIQCKAKSAVCLDVRASRQYPFHVFRLSELAAVQDVSAASFGTRLLSHTVGAQY